MFFRKSIDYRVNSSPRRIFDYLQRSECELSLSLTSFLLIPLQRPLLNSCKKHNFEFERFWLNLFAVTLMKYPKQLRLYDWVSYFPGASLRTPWGRPSSKLASGPLVTATTLVTSSLRSYI